MEVNLQVVLVKSVESGRSGPTFLMVTRITCNG
jgi:hypothetical protein